MTKVAASPSMGLEEARVVTEAIRRSVREVHDLLLEAYQGRAWTALGYGTWDAYCRAEFADLRGSLGTDDRRAAVVELTNNGMSVRAVSSALGVPRSTVSDDRHRQVSGNRTPAPEATVVPLSTWTTTGVDGKAYERTPDYVTGPPPRSRRPRKPLTTDAFNAQTALDKALIRVERVLRDDRYTANRTAVDHRLRHVSQRLLVLLSEFYGQKQATLLDGRGSVGGER